MKSFYIDGIAVVLKDHIPQEPKLTIGSKGVVSTLIPPLEMYMACDFPVVGHWVWVHMDSLDFPLS